MRPRPKFLSTFFTALGVTAEHDGWYHLIPVWLIIGGALGGAVAWYMPVNFWTIARWDVSATVYTGFLAFDGILLALGWGAFSKISEVLCADQFSKFLRKHNLLDMHLMVMDYIHGVLVVSAIGSLLGLLSVFLHIPMLAHRIILATVIALSFYSLVKAFSAMKMMNDLIWDYAHFEPSERSHLTPIAGDGTTR